MLKSTKVICTIGPAVCSLEKIQTLLAAGMNVARLNFSHGTHQEHAQTIALLKEARRKAQVPLAIMLDTKGPEIRLGKLKSKELILKEGQQFFFVKEPIEGDSERITITPGFVLDSFKEQMFVFLDNGYIITHVVEVTPQGVKVEVDHGGILQSTKGVNIPGIELQLPAITEEDKQDICFGCQQDVDMIALSFVRSAEDVLIIKKMLEEQKKADIMVVAKIENQLGVKNFDSILSVSDGIMVARGDLGVELPLTRVPGLQKMMIKEGYLSGKPVVIATQMLESMIVNPRPTRAETSDVANAIYDSASAVMLSGETAIGSYPVKVVETMSAIIQETEKDIDYKSFVDRSAWKTFRDVPSSVALACVETAYSSDAKAIFAFTTTGFTARLLSSLRPKIPVIAVTTNEKVYLQLSLFWGIVPLLYTKAQTIEEAYERVCSFALEQGYVQKGDIVVITAGVPFGRPGTTNTMIVNMIGSNI